VEQVSIEAADGSRAEISLLGAEITRWQVREIDLLWTPNPQYWRRTSPILFPVVGWLRNDGIIIHGRRRPMTVHGFAKSSFFTIVERSNSAVTVELAPSKETLELYPFEFRLRLRYSLESTALLIEAEVSNVGPDPMPYSFGVHPGFCWPLPGLDGRPHAVCFASPESDSVPLITPEGFICREQRRIQFDGKTLVLESSLFENDALCFLNANSSRVVFGDRRTTAIEIASSGFPHWAIWSRPGANFVSIENWTGYGDAPDFDGSIFEKPSMIVLSPGDSKRHDVAWRFHSEP
jgi:galactose mutarotase-like enzyme